MPPVGPARSPAPAGHISALRMAAAGCFCSWDSGHVLSWPCFRVYADIQCRISLRTFRCIQPLVLCLLTFQIVFEVNVFVFTDSLPSKTTHFYTWLQVPVY